MVGPSAHCSVAIVSIANRRLTIASPAAGPAHEPQSVAAAVAETSLAQLFSAELASPGLHACIATTAYTYIHAQVERRGESQAASPTWCPEAATEWSTRAIAV